MVAQTGHFAHDSAFFTSTGTLATGSSPPLFISSRRHRRFALYSRVDAVGPPLWRCTATAIQNKVRFCFLLKCYELIFVITIRRHLAWVLVSLLKETSLSEWCCTLPFCSPPSMCCCCTVCSPCILAVVKLNVSPHTVVFLPNQGARGTERNNSIGAACVG